MHLLAWHVRDGVGDRAVPSRRVRYTGVERADPRLRLGIGSAQWTASGLYWVANGAGSFIAGAVIWLVITAAGWLYELTVRRKARRLRLHGDQLETDELWVELTTDPDIHLERVHNRHTLALVLGWTRIYLGGIWCASHFEPDDLRAISERLERSIYEQCQEIGLRLRLLADCPRRSSWPDTDL